MYEYNLATIPRRGGMLGKRMLERWLREDPKNTKYVLKTDIHHFYPSIDHDILKNKLCRRFKDKELLRLLFSIIDVYPKGLPLGLYTSQWFANFFLEAEDHKIKEIYKAPYYLRYMDDQVIIGPNKRKLHKMLNHMQADMNSIGLEIKPTWQIWPVNSRFIDFLGYRFYRNHTTLRERNFLRIKRKAKTIHKKGFISPHDAHSMIGYWGWIKHSNSYSFYEKYVKLYISLKKCKEVLKHGNK